MPTGNSPRLSFVYKDFGSPLAVLDLVETELPSLSPGRLRVAVSHVPVNPSDLIPITGAYSHRTVLPAIAGYEGVGRVIGAPAELSHLLGRRVLPLRGEGTWQTIVDCPADHAVEVPEAICDLVAARAYVNPLAAFTMLQNWPVRDRTILLTGAGSSCANYLGNWAKRQGAERVVGIYRSECRAKQMRALGIEPVAMQAGAKILEVAKQADVTFDALGGDIASKILAMMREGTSFVAYGLLSGKPVTVTEKTTATYSRFHMRDHLRSFGRLGALEAFETIWPLLLKSPPPEPAVLPARSWREALAEVVKPGAQKQVLDISSLA